MELKILAFITTFLNLMDLIGGQRIAEESLGRSCRAARGQFAHETFCHYYYNCWDGRATLEQCPGELLFNTINGRCDYPEAVSCSGRIRNPAPYVSGGLCLKEWGIFPDQTDCRAFYECAHGRAFRKVCPTYTAFDERYLVCVHAYNVDCRGRGGVYGALISGPIYAPQSLEKAGGIGSSGRGTSSGLGSSGRGTSAALGSSGRGTSSGFGSSGRGTSSGFEGSGRVTSSGLGGSGRVTAVGPIGPVGSIGGSDREKQYETPVSPDTTFRCPHPRGLYGYALDCSKFWLCREYRPSLLKCPSGQLFDMASLTCTDPENTQCSVITSRS